MAFCVFLHWFAHDAGHGLNSHYWTLLSTCIVCSADAESIDY